MVLGSVFFLLIYTRRSPLLAPFAKGVDWGEKGVRKGGE